MSGAGGDMKRTLCATLILAAAFGSWSSAHHSYSAFDLQRLVEIDGVLEELVWVSPHSIFKIRSDDGRLYSGEWRAPIAMQRVGMTRDTLRTGERIVLVGNPRRDIDESGILNVKSIRRTSDGGQWPAN
jgi:hypothetical protein